MVGKKSEDGYILSIVVGLSFVAMSIFAIVLVAYQFLRVILIIYLQHVILRDQD